MKQTTGERMTRISAISTLGAFVALTGCDPIIKDPKNPCAGKDSVSTGQPVPRLAVSPAHIKTAINGAGHGLTWDGRVFVLATFDEQGRHGWRLRAFRPERVGKDSAGRPTFPDEAFSQPYTWDLSANPDHGATELNTLALAPVPGYPENPYRQGTSSVYEVNVYTSLADIVMGMRRGRFVVADAETREARISEATFDGPFRPLRTAKGKAIKGIEPSFTFDGRLMVYQGSPDNNGGIDWLMYSWNAEAGRLDGWSEPRSISEMYYVDRNKDVAGIPFYERYPIAKEVMRDASGQIYLPGEAHYGAYPWISQDGTEIFHTGAQGGCHRNNPACPEGRWGERALRGGYSVIGRWTGWANRHIDGPINLTRHDEGPEPTLHTIFVSPGAYGTMWAPWQEQEELPYTGGRPVYPLIGAVLGDYDEVSFEDHEDGNYAVYLGMNEMLLRKGSWEISRTPDTSGNFNNGELEGARFAPENHGVDESVGKKGKAIFFPDQGGVRVKNSKSLQDFGLGLTAEVYVKRLADLSGDDENRFRLLLNLPGTFNLILEEGGVVQSTVFAKRGSGTEERRSGGVGPELPLNTWVHVALSYDPGSGLLRTYVDGALRNTSSFSPAPIADSKKDLIIGPGSQVGPPLPDQDQAILILDEVKISRVVRSDREIAISAMRYSAPPPAPPVNPRAAALGERLFFDPILSGERVISCATCHRPELAFTDGLAVATGVGGKRLKRNTSTILNRGATTAQFWDLRAHSLEAQALIPIENPEEMNLPLGEAVSRLRADGSYVQAFRDAFGADPDGNLLAQAIAAFERSQVSRPSRVDRYEAGDGGALSEAEARGRIVFRNQGRCIACHSGTNFSDETAHNTAAVCGKDGGVGELTGRAHDWRQFKTPTLRDIAATAPYLHDGSVATLEEVIERYDRGGTHTDNRDSEIRPLGLSGQEKSDLAAFLRALSGE